MMKLKKYFAFLLLTTIMIGCKTPQLGYFQDLKNGDVNKISCPSIVKVQPGDKLSILVSSKEPALAYLYNLPVVGHYQASTSGKSLNMSTVASYTVDQSGCIDFPYLGQIEIKGLTRSELSAKIKNMLIENNLLKDPSVTVDFLDMYFSVTGEVKTPGRFLIDHDQVTILDALSRAGDLTIYGRRDNLLVMRQDGNEQKAYRINLANAEELYTSPVFYLQQNDVVYVEPNERRAKESTEVGTALSNPSIWISAASLLTTISVVLFK